MMIDYKTKRIKFRRIKYLSNGVIPPLLFTFAGMLKRSKIEEILIDQHFEIEATLKKFSVDGFYLMEN